MVLDFERRFDNWVRWCLAVGAHRGHTGSVEGRYRSPQCWESPQPRGEGIDVVDAEAVNRAYAVLAQTEWKMARVIKVVKFRSYWRPQWQGQKLGIHYLRIEGAFVEAKQRFRSVLDRIEGRGYKPLVTRINLTVVAVQLRGSEAVVSENG